MPTFARILETRKFLNSIKYNVNKDYLILIVDDHPEKVTLKNIQQNERVKVFPAENELWWVGSVNLGISKLFNEYKLQDEDTVIFANNDIEIDKHSFELLYKEHKKNNFQIIHPRTFDQNGIEVSSGAKILSYFPYITKHPKNFVEQKTAIDMGTARFLMASGLVLKKVGYINKNLVQYGGDNDFTLRAKRFHNINTYILRDAVCTLDDSQTGIKNHNIQNIKEFYMSFFSIKSPNNINFRYMLFREFFGKFGAFFITASITLNTIIKFFFRKN